MPRSPRAALSCALCAFLLAGCGGEIARIEGLPPTRDVSGADWPRLVDTPAPPVDALLPETGARRLALLSETRDAVLDRAARPGNAPVASDELGARVVRIREQAERRTAPAIDRAALAARAARLSAMRAQPVAGPDAAALRARARRPGPPVAGGVDGAALRARVRRPAPPVAGGADGATLRARAERIRAETSRPMDTAPRPVARRPDTDAPVVSDAFRRRAEEALRRARERAAAGDG